MKTLVKNGVSLMILNDDTPLKMGSVVEIGNPVKVKINNEDNAVVLYENITPPLNYVGKRFCFDGSEWSFNYNWRDPKFTASKR